MDSSPDVRKAASMLLGACRAMLAVDRYDPMSNPPRPAEMDAIELIRQSVRYASRIENLFQKDVDFDREYALLERSGLIRAQCQSCGEEILIRIDDEESCVKCAGRVGT